MKWKRISTKSYRISEFKHWANQLCPAIKATDKGQSFICAPAHMNIDTLAMRSKKHVIEECDAAMLRLVVPIFADGEFVGAVGACGVLLDDGEVDDFWVNKMTDISEDQIKTLSIGVASIPTEKAEELGQYIVNQINEIVGVAKQNLQ